VRIIELSRLYLTTGMLLEGGIPILAALDIVGNTVSPTTRAALLVARGIISDGGTLSQGFDHCGLATPIALRMLRVGERSGQLGAMLTRSALFYEGESARWIERFTKVFEPVLMTAIGLLVGLIVVLLYMPIFDLAGRCNERAREPATESLLADDLLQQARRLARCRDVRCSANSRR
jgi:general secretion pathway protein F